MTATPKQALREIEKAPPGERFRCLYRKRQQARHARWMNAAFNIGGLVVIGIGIATYPIPVIPSEIVILIGLALISQGSMRGAAISTARKCACAAGSRRHRNCGSACRSGCAEPWPWSGCSGSRA